MTERPDLDWVAQVSGGRLRRPRRVELGGFSIDSRTLRPGELFIALRGERTDGHLFLEEAFRRGASGALVSRSVKLTEGLYNILEVEDTEAALWVLARAWRAEFNGPIIGITGSAGKTTTKELLFSILSKHYRAYRSPGNYNTEIGLPLAILGMPRGAEIGVFELGLQQPGEVGQLAKLLRPTVGMITNVGEAHLGFFHDREELAESKWELIEQLSQDGLALLHYDSPYLRRRMEGLERAITFGIAEAADYRATKIDDTSLKGLRFALSSPQAEFHVGSHLLGRFNVHNILAAVAAALELGASTEDIREAVAEFRPFPHRMELRRSPVGLIIDDSYNANPSSTEGALTALARLRTHRRKVFVFGDMLELGAGADEAHREIAEVIAGSDIDLVFTLGKLAGKMGRALQRQGFGGQVLRANSMDDLKEALLSHLPDGRNLILVKGSRAMELDQLVISLSSK